MRFRAYKPGVPLSDFVGHLWLYEGYSSAYVHERIFPTGAFELVFSLRSDELRIYNDSESVPCSRYSGALISGPYDAFFVTERTEEASAMGVHFRPGGAFPFLGLSAHEFANTHLDLATIWGRDAEELRERLVAADSPESRFRLLEHLLLSRLNRPLAHHPAVSLALKSLHSDHSRGLVRKLAREAELSDRRFINVFRYEVGLNPKLFNRIARFYGVLAKLHRSSDPDWDQLALEHGYFDQSHLIHDFLEFSGISPAGYLRRLKSLHEKGLHVKLNHLPVGS
jgi:AraC-like DNA-binding protein